jgi:hypothetical protein
MSAAASFSQALTVDSALQLVDTKSLLLLLLLLLVLMRLASLLLPCIMLTHSR